MRVGTYNIHRCRGLDGRTRPDRIAEVLQGIDADVIALQEVVGAGPRHDGHAQEIRRGARHGLGHGADAAPAPATQYGNVVLSAASPSCTTSATTCRGRRANRAAASGWTWTWTDGSLHLYNVHFGTAILERRVQAERLAGIVCDRRVTGPKVVLGDFNEWTRGPASALLSERLQGVDLGGAPAAPAHVSGRAARWCTSITSTTQARVEVERVELVRTRRALIASDHLPLVATLRVGS